MATTSYLDLVNGVLKRLRREQATDVTGTDYIDLVAELVNEAKREVEDAYNWEALYTKTAVTTVASTSTYTLTGYGDRARIVFVFDATTKRELIAGRRRWVEYQRQFTSDPNGAPQRWLLNAFSGGDPLLELWPTPDGVNTVNVHAYVPQADLADKDDTLSVPHLPVILKAYALAISERGEDGGVSQTAAEERAEKVLGELVAIENSRHAHGTESDWYVDWMANTRRLQTWTVEGGW